MRNLKKVLTLVLTVAMLLSIMVVGTGAAFSDQDKIENTEAVDMCVALNIIAGFPDGTYRPSNNVTRAEMCKMICITLNGGKEPNLGTNNTPTFNDVRNNASTAWAEGYIESCYTQGIVSGVGGGRFNPNGSITGTQAARMLLVALGYNATNEKFTGDSWAVNVNVRATQKGLYKGIESIDTNAALTRDSAAQMIKNALDANMVSYNNEFTTGPNGQIIATPVLADKQAQNGGPITLLVDKYEATTEKDGILYSVQVDSKGTYTLKTTTGTYSKVAKDYSDLMGQQVDVMVEKADHSKVFGVYASEDSVVLASGYVSQLEADGNDIKLDGTSYKTDSKNLTDNIVWSANSSATAVTDKDGKVTGYTYGQTDLQTLATSAGKNVVTPDTAASTIKLIDNNGDGKVDSALRTPVHIAKVTAVSKTSISLNYLTSGVTNKAIKFDDAEVYSGIAKDDFVAVTFNADRAADSDLITKLDVISAKADATRTNEGKVNGEWYKLATLKDSSKVAITTNNTYDFVMIGGVIVNSDETAAAASDIAYIAAVSANTDSMVGDNDQTIKVRMYFQDNTNSEVTVSRVDGKKIRATANADYADKAAVTALTKKMVTFSKLSDGTYDVKAVNAGNKVGMDWVATISETSSTVYNKQKIGGYSIADDAVVFVTTGNETKVLTGKQVKNWADTVSSNFAAADAQALTKATNGVAYIKYATLATTDTNNVPGSSKDILYAYLTANSYEGTLNGEKKTAMEVWTGNENKTLYIDQSGTGSYSAGDVIKYTVNGDFVENIGVLNTNRVAVTGLDGDNIVWRIKGDAASKNAELDKDCVFIAINDDKNEGVEGGSRDGISTDPTEVEISGITYLVPNAYIIREDGKPVDGDIVAIIFDSDDGQLNVATNVSTDLIAK